MRGKILMAGICGLTERQMGNRTRKKSLLQRFITDHEECIALRILNIKKVDG